MRAMRIRPLLAVAALLLLTPFAEAGSRESFLKLIDRPRVAPEVAERAVSGAPAGMAQFHVTFTSEAGQRVPFILLKPADAKPGARLPVVIALHGTSSKKESNLGLLKRFVEKGFMGIAPDGRYHGERCAKGSGAEEYFREITKAFEDGKSHPWLYDTVYDVMRLIDVLEARPDVDAKRIGVMGFSKGGMECYLLAAADPRVAVAVPCIGVQTFKYGLETDGWKARVGTVQAGFDGAMKAAGVEKADAAFAKRFYDRVIPGIDGEFDGPAMLPLIAPRPLMVINGDSDANTPLEGVKIAGAAAREAYEKAGVPERFVLKIQEKTGHRVNPDSTAEAVEWFVKWFGR
jgi:dienelactone hydrolase